MLVAENGRMAIHSMCGLCTWYNMHMLVAENGRMAVHPSAARLKGYDKLNWRFIYEDSSDRSEWPAWS